VSLATFQLSSYSFKQNKKNTLELNQLLTKLDIEGVPVFDNTSMEPTFRTNVQEDERHEKEDKKEEIEMQEINMEKI